MIYLDYAATTPPQKKVLDVFCEVEKNYFANTSSLHIWGVEGSQLEKKARENIAKSLKVCVSEIIFTSGATEANNMVLFGVARSYQNRGKHIITTLIEHSSIYDTAKILERDYGFEITYIAPNSEGLIDATDVINALRGDTILVSVAQVNSELGNICDVEKIAEHLKNIPTVLFHVDAVQAFTKIPLNLENIDFMSISSHKIYGLKNIGALYKSEKTKLEPLIYGGMQENNNRAGTFSLGLKVSFAKAINLALKDMKDNYTYVSTLNKYLREELKEFEFNSSANAIPHILNIDIKEIKSETMVNYLGSCGFIVGAGSACNANKPSRVIESINKKEGIRVCLSHLTTKDELKDFIKCFKEAMKIL